MLRNLLSRLILTLMVLVLAALAPASARAQVPSVSGDSDAYVEATVDLAEPWQGQQITYVFRYYEAVDALRLPGVLVGQPDYESPEFANFWQEGEIEQTNYQETINGRTYNVSELHTILFPTTAGSITIPPARLILRDLPGAGERVLETLPVAIAVKPLPEGAPEPFSGAIGDYRLTAQVDRTATNVDEPITLRLTLSGTGNIRLAPAPALPELDGWRILQRGEDVRVDKLGEQIVGTRTIDYLLLPSTGGKISFPPLEYVFFSPVDASYRGALTDPIELVAEGGSPAPAQPTVVPIGAPVTEPAVGLLPGAGESGGRRSLPSVAPMEAPARLPPASAPLAGSAWYWALWLAPLAAIGVGIGTKTRARHADERQRQRTQARAGAEALRTLASAGSGSAPAETVARAQRVLTDYLECKLASPIAGLTRSDVAALLHQRSVPAPAVGAVHECLTLGELARFSPSAVDPSMGASMRAKVETAIRALDKVLE